MASGFGGLVWFGVIMAARSEVWGLIYIPYVQHYSFRLGLRLGVDDICILGSIFGMIVLVMVVVGSNILAIGIRGSHVCLRRGCESGFVFGLRSGPE